MKVEKGEGGERSRWRKVEVEKGGGGKRWRWRKEVEKGGDGERWRWRKGEGHNFLNPSKGRVIKNYTVKRRG